MRPYVLQWTLLVLLVLELVSPRTTVARVLTVCRTGCDHATVQGAINAAQPGDMIRLKEGVYRESIRIDRDLTIEGDDAETTVLDGSGPTTVVVVNEGVTVTLSQVTITNGVGDSGGTAKDAGGVHNLGTLTLTRTAVRGNTAPENGDGRGKGGGIRNDGTLTIHYGFVSNNTAGGRGGAIYNEGLLSMDSVTFCENSGSFGGGIFNNAEVVLTNCTFDSNYATSDGGAILNQNSCILTNCTISGNTADRDGGGFWVGGMQVAQTETRLTHCTVTENEVSNGEGAGIFNATSSAVELRGTIVASNVQGKECSGATLSLGYNLDSDDSCNLDPASEQPDMPGVNPLLSQLGHHRGPTLTHAFLAGSPAIDAAGAQCSITTDQRGFPRPIGGRCDMGAYERPSCSAVASVSFRRGEVNGDGLVDVSDAVFLLSFLFIEPSVLTCEDAGDANDDGKLDLPDAIFLLSWLFQGGATLPGPRSCGPDPTFDTLACDVGPGCQDGEPGAEIAPGGDNGGAPSPGYQDLWTSAAELAEQPLSGPAWESLWTAASEACAGEATVTNQDSNNNVQILAAAIVYARTASTDPSSAALFRNTVVAALERLVEEGNPRETHGCPFGCGKAVNQTLGWGREVGAYVLAADLVRYRTTAFEEWLRNMAATYVACDGRTMRVAFQRRPNNWGVMNFGSLVAMYAYLGDDEALGEIRAYFVRGLSEGVPDCSNAADGEPCYVWGGTLDPLDKDMTWHCDPADPKLIAPPCTVQLKDGTSIDLDGLIPDDQRRACSFCPPGESAAFCSSISEADHCVTPQEDSHITDWMNGAVMGARILDRIGMGIWDAGQEALKRMIIAHLVTHCQVTCDDTGFRCESLYNCKDWVIPILDEAYDLETQLTPPPPTECECPLEITGRGTGASKNAGFGAYIIP